MLPQKSKNKIIYTIGHSTLSISNFINLLKVYKINQLVDVRTIPKSSYNPQFSKDYISRSLSAESIKYFHLKEVGGLRKPNKDSVNLGWRNMSFRGYADYMQTVDFKKGFQTLEELASKELTIIMCAEVVPWRCHRSLLSDYLYIKGWEVFHIYNKTSAKLHKLTPFAKIEGGELSYPAKVSQMSYL